MSEEKPPEKKLRVISSHKPLSEQEIMDVQFAAIHESREKYVSGIMIGLVKDDCVECYTYRLPECDVDDMLDLVDMMKNEIIDSDLGMEDGEF